MRLSMIYGTNKLPLSNYGIDFWLYRYLHGRSILLSYDILPRCYGFTYSIDAADKIIMLIGNKSSFGEIVNIAADSSVTWEGLVNIYNNILVELK